MAADGPVGGGIDQAEAAAGCNLPGLGTKGLATMAFVARQPTLLLLPLPLLMMMMLIMLMMMTRPP